MRHNAQQSGFCFPFSFKFQEMRFLVREVCQCAVTGLFQIWQKQVKPPVLYVESFLALEHAKIFDPYSRQHVQTEAFQL